MGHIVVDVDGKAPHRLVTLPIAERRQDSARRSVLGAQAIPAAHNLRFREGGARQRRHHIQVQRLSNGRGLLAAVHDHDIFRRGRQGRHKAVRCKGAVEAHLHQANLFPLGVHIVHHFFRRVADRPHGNHHGLRVRGAIVIKQLVVSPQALVDLPHILFHHSGESIIILVAGLIDLEEDIRILGRTPQYRVLRVQCPCPEGMQRIHVHHGLELIVVPHLYLLDLMGGPESVKEMEEGNPPADGGQVGHRAQVHDLLGIGAAQHGISRGTAGHHVTVVAKDRQRMGRQRPGGNMGHPRQQAAGNLVHIRDHQQKALGSGERGGQCPGGQGAVDRAGSASLRLHDGDLYWLAEHILPPLGRPFIRQLCHHRGWGNGIDCRDFRKGICHMGRRSIAIHCLALSCHVDSSLSQRKRETLCWIFPDIQR